MSAEQTPDIEALAARLFLADPDRVEPGPWMSMAEVHQRPYRLMARAATDVFAPVLTAAVREAEQRAEIAGQMKHITAEMVRGDQPLDEKEELIADLRARLSHAEAKAAGGEHECKTGSLCDGWPFGVDDAYRTIAAVAWPAEREENRDGWAVTMRHRPDLFEQEATRARERLEAAIAHGRAAIVRADRVAEPQHEAATSSNESEAGR